MSKKNVTSRKSSGYRWKLAHYEHLPIFRAAYDLTVLIEKIVRNFSRYNKYTLGTDLRNRSRAILQKIIIANNTRDDRAAHLLELRQEIESFKVLARLCQDSGAFASTRSYLNIAERITDLARQNEGWLKDTQRKSRKRSKPAQETKRSQPQPAQLALELASQHQKEMGR